MARQDGDTQAFASALTIRQLTVRAVNLPLDPPVKTAAGEVGHAPLVLMDIVTEEGVTGRAYIFTYTPVVLGAAAKLAESLGPLVAGKTLAPATLSRQLAARFKLLGTEGLLGMVLALFDMAAWDALAKAAALPLSAFLGADRQQPTQAYASLRGWTAKELAKEAESAMALGFRAIKLKFGHATLDAEREVYAAVRSAVGDSVEIYVDPNQAFTVAEAHVRARHYAEWGVGWLEEPVRAGDLAGHAAIARATPGLPVQRGENDCGPDGIAASIAAVASGLLMPDVMKVGGVTGWMESQALCKAAGIPVSSHLFVEASAHLLAASPTRHRLEWLDIAAPILDSGTPVLQDGFATPCQRPGLGLEWREDAVKRFAL
jgi:mandelate racemase